MRRTTRLVRIAVPGLLTLAAVGCGSAGTSSGNGAAGSPVRGGDLVFARTADNTSLDPTLPGDNESIWTDQQIFETLYTVAADGKTLVPALATSYTRSPDNTKFTFTLRRGVTFSNGRPMTAADVKWSIDRARNGGKGLTYIDAPIKDIAAPTPSTVVITTKYPWAPLLADVSLFVNGVVPKNLAGMSPSAFWQHPIATGPFMVGTWKHGDALKLVRNPHYRVTGKPYLNSITYTNVPDDNQRILQLKSGQAQVDRFPPFSSLTSLSSTPNVVATPFAGTRVDYILMNERVKPYADVHVRRAISYAIDRAAIVKAILFGNGKPADSFLSPSDLYYRPQAIAFDMAKAKQEMAASSVPHGFSTTYLTTSADARLAEIVQQQLAPLGIHVKIKTVDVNQVFEVQGKGDYEISHEYWTQDIPDPDERTAWFLNESASKDYFTGYHNPRMQQLVQQSERVFDPGKRAALYASMQALHAQDLPQIPLYYAPYQYAYSTRVHGFSVSPLGNQHLEDVWVK